VQLDLVGSAPSGSEDCLYINVWTPANVDASSRLDVMVHVHDGGLMTGSGHEPCELSRLFLCYQPGLKNTGFF